MIGLICALDVEVQGIKDKMENVQVFKKATIEYYSGTIDGFEVVCAECGVGKVNAAMSTQVMIDQFNPELIINSGIAGALTRDLSVGDIVIADDCVQHDMDGTEMGDPPGMIWYHDEKRIDIPADRLLADLLEKACGVLEDTKVVRGRVATGDAFLAKRHRRQKVADTFKAIACEMEGGAVGQVCYRNGTPYGAIRCISDDFDEYRFVDYVKFREEAAAKSIKVIEEVIRLRKAGVKF